MCFETNLACLRAEERGFLKEVIGNKLARRSAKESVAKQPSQDTKHAANSETSVSSDPLNLAEVHDGSTPAALDEPPPL